MIFYSKEVWVMVGLFPIFQKDYHFPPFQYENQKV